MSVDRSLSRSITGTNSVTDSLSSKLSGVNSADFFHHNEEKVNESGGGCGDEKDSKIIAARASSGSSISDSNESSCSNNNKPHKGNDKNWDATQVIRMRDGALGLSHFRLLKRLGCGDVGTVYLAELRGSDCCFAMKVMDKGSLATRKKLHRAQTEREILALLDHPFLPTLYSHIETDKFSCLVMEYCMGGDLHVLRQQQPGKHFTEQAARFYASEVLLTLEYLHMLGVIYRDLKPENVLIREDGHIMLSDFDLSLRSIVSPTLVKSSALDVETVQFYCIKPLCVQPSCAQPPCAQSSCLVPGLMFQKSKKNRKPKTDNGFQLSPLPELVAEPTGVHSMSFVGTHEYLAPEIIKGEGHGSAVDWWTFGIFLYELLHGKTPFKGSGNRATLYNVVGQPLKFPEKFGVSFAARDLIQGLLVKDPQQRLASKRGATEIKRHPFFEGVNWALIRSSLPPETPQSVELESTGGKNSLIEKLKNVDSNSSESYMNFEFF